MICLQCKKQIPDDSVSCPLCGHEVNYERQILHEVKFRRYQRWAFYAVIALLFLGMTGVMVKIYSANTKLLTDMANAKGDLAKRSEELTNAQSDLAEKNSQLGQTAEDLAKAKNDLDKRTADFKKAAEDKSQLEKNLQNTEQYKALLSAANAGIYGLIVKLGTGISERDLFKIPVADANLSGGKDSDSDGLSDVFEAAIGTDPSKADTDGDGYSDKDEILGGFNPRGEGKQAIDMSYANKQKGKILLQVENYGEAWYVNQADGKRYFLGKPADGMEEISSAGINATSSPATIATSTAE